MISLTFHCAILGEVSAEEFFSLQFASQEGYEEALTRLVQAEVKGKSEIWRCYTDRNKLMVRRDTLPLFQGVEYRVCPVDEARCSSC